MDLAQTLVRSVMRTFYETKHILVIDALIIHSALRDDDMAILMGMNKKELHKLCGKLKEDRFLAVHTRSEMKEGQQRPINITYYYIDYRATIDAIKWRVYCIDKTVQGSTVPLEDRKEYSCPRCKSQWTQMEVLDKVDFQRGFLCHKCGFPLVRNEDNDRGGHEQSTRLNAQFRFITDLLPKIDQVIIPDNNFEAALASARPILRDALHPVAETVPVADSLNRPTAVRGLGDNSLQSVKLTITSSDGPTAADKAAEKARKEAIALQNQMPAHFTHSTITGERVMNNTMPSLTSSQIEDSKDSKDFKDSTNITPSITGDDEAIDDYFTKLKEETARVREQEEEEEEETDEDDEDDDEEDIAFEDVVPANTGTPASSMSANGEPKSGHGGSLVSALKKGTGTRSSTAEPSTGATSPETPDSGRAAKKVRISAPEVKDEEESEEDMEFEDV